MILFRLFISVARMAPDIIGWMLKSNIQIIFPEEYCKFEKWLETIEGVVSETWRQMMWQLEGKPMR